MDRRTVIVTTAGHVDHGKTTLIKALTGIDLDTLPEEKARGITVALGFAHLDLGDTRVAFVDVPGHESLVRTMAAGAHGVDAAMLIVSAAEGVMPQTREHAAILSLLGVPDGLVVLTHADQVDEDMLALAAADVEDLTRGTFLEGRPVLPVSSVTGAGLDALREALTRLPLRPRTADGAFRLPVDRVFVRPGFGTVVTGTTIGGRLKDGASVRILPDGATARVRGVQVHGDKVGEVGPGVRAALNLAGLDREELTRGAVVVLGEVPCVSVIDVHYRHVSDEVAMLDGAPVRLLLGTSERDGHLHLADARELLVDGDTAYAQLRLDSPLPCCPGDRFVLRRASPATTLGGGEVVDPWATRMPRKAREGWGAELARLHAGDVAVWLERVGEVGMPVAEWRARTAVAAGITLGDRVLDELVVARLITLVTQALLRFHVENPLARGAARRELRRERLANLSDATFDALLERVATSGAVALEGPLVRVVGWEVALTPAQQALQARIGEAVEAAGAEGVASEDLREPFPEPATEALLRLLEDQGAVVRVAGLGWVGARALAALRDGLSAWFDGHDRPLTPAEFRDQFGLTRRTTIPWLEWLDKQGWTKRTQDGRGAGASLRD